MIVKICVGSSCHLKGAPEIAELFQTYVSANNLDDQIALVGSFCAGKCNRTGVTVSVDDDVYPGVTPETFKEFWKEKIMSRINESKAVL